jgi:hypothetical protein
MIAVIRARPLALEAIPEHANDKRMPAYLRERRFTHGRTAAARTIRPYPMISGSCYEHVMNIPILIRALAGAPRPPR